MNIQGGKDIYADCWLVGAGRVEAGDARRYTEVRIWLTPGGTLITNRTNGTVDGNFTGTSSTGCAHSSPDSAYQWLLKDGKGKLGPVSKEAWVKACRNVPPMAGLEYERIA